MEKCLASHISEIDESYLVVSLLSEQRTCGSSALCFLILSLSFD
jgi:hypothetical protein